MPKDDRPSPPDTVREEVVEEVHGTPVDDPYRWLEGDGEEVEAWIERQNEYADHFLETETAEALRPRFQDLARVTDYGGIVAEGGWYFQQIEGPDEDQPVLYVRGELNEDRRKLVDPNAFDGENPSMDWYTISPAGNRLAYGYAEGGDEQYDIRVIDIETGAQVDEVPDTGRTHGFGLVWNDEKGFYYVRTGGPGGGDQLEKSLCYHELDTDPQTDAELTADFDEHAWVSLERDQTTGTVVVTVSHGTTHSELYYLDEAAVPPNGSDSGDPLEPILTGYDAHFEANLDNGQLYVLTDHAAPFYRVLTASVDAATTDAPLDAEEMTEAISEGEAVLQSLAFADDYVLAHRLQDANAELSVHERDGTYLREVSLPPHVTLGGLNGTDDRREIFFTIQSFDRPAEVTRYDLETEQRSVLDRPEVSVDIELNVTQRFVESSDGTEVPAYVVHQEGLELNGENPAIITGYGGFRISRTPAFDRFRLPFLEHGGVWVHTCLRGGTEYGEPWHEAGMLENKQNVFDDFFAVAEEICEAGYSSPDRLAAVGGSNGGLLVGAAITQRPDLWAAAFCSVPLLDMLRYHEFLLGEYWTVEYGSPDDPEAFEWLSAYSPYHNASETEYPATMFKTALGDTRVHPAHARKMTPLLQELNTGSNPIILRTERNTGHGVGKPTSMVVREQAERWGFLFDHLGIEAA